MLNTTSNTFRKTEQWGTVLGFFGQESQGSSINSLTPYNQYPQDTLAQAHFSKWTGSIADAPVILAPVILALLNYDADNISRDCIQVWLRPVLGRFAGSTPYSLSLHCAFSHGFCFLLLQQYVTIKAFSWEPLTLWDWCHHFFFHHTQR